MSDINKAINQMARGLTLLSDAKPDQAALDALSYFEQVLDCLERYKKTESNHAALVEAVGNWLHNDDTFHPADAEWRARDKRLIKQMRKAYEALTNGDNNG